MTLSTEPTSPTSLTKQNTITPIMPDIQTVVDPQIRHSTRPKQPPMWHKDYMLSSQVNHSTLSLSPTLSTRYLLSNFLSYSRISPKHYIF